MQSQKLDIVELIETNPITKLSKNYQGKFLEKIQNTFTETEQRLFVSSLYIYLNYDSKKDFIIELESVWKWLGFSRKDPCKVVLEKHFTKNIDYKIIKIDSEVIKEIKAPEVAGASKVRGIAGLNKEKILMTINTFKKLCLKSNTKKADEIHDYFIKLEELTLETITEESIELKNQLQQKVQEIKDQETHYNINLNTNKHKLLLEKFNFKKCIYLGQIIINGITYIKLGSTEDINSRCKTHLTTYGNFILLDIFESDYFREIESEILSDTTIKDNLYRETINGHFSRECVKLYDLFNYDQLINIVKIYINKIRRCSDELLIEKQRIELENKKLDYELISKLIGNPEYTDFVKSKLENLNFKNTNSLVEKQIEIIERPLYNDETNINDIKMNLDTQIKGRKPKGQKVQKIDPNNFENFTVYDSMVYVLRAPENKGFQKSGIQTAIKNNTIYKEFRWNFVIQDLNPDIVNIKPTVEFKNKPPIINTIIQLNSDKTLVVNTFYTKNDSAKFLKIGKIKMKSIIEKQELYNNHYYIELHKCSQELLDKYTKPINRIIPNNSKQINQIHPVSKQTVIFNSLSEIYIKFGIASTTIIDAIENKTICNGFIWEFV